MCYSLSLCLILFLCFRYSLGDGGGWRGRSEDASLLSVRGHREHGVQDGEQWSGDYTHKFNRPLPGNVCQITRCKQYK